MNNKTYIYFLLTHHKNYHELIPINEILYYGNTKYQNVLIAKNELYGTFLALDGKIQSCEIDEFRYHEAITFPALVTHKDPKEVLVIGNGEGSIIKYLTMFPLEKIVWVDIDRELVEICKKYLPYSFKGKDNRVFFYSDDGLNFLKSTKEKFDIIIFDLTDPSDENPLSNHLYSKEGALLVKDHLKDDGIFVTLAYERIENGWRRSASYLHNLFKIVRYYGTWVPSFNTYILFAFASDFYDPLKISVEEINEKIKSFNLKFYNGLVHKLMFSLIF